MVNNILKRIGLCTAGFGLAFGMYFLGYKDGRGQGRQEVIESVDYSIKIKNVDPNKDWIRDTEVSYSDGQRTYEKIFYSTGRGELTPEQIKKEYEGNAGQLFMEHSQEKK